MSHFAPPYPDSKDRCMNAHTALWRFVRTRFAVRRMLAHWHIIAWAASPQISLKNVYKSSEQVLSYKYHRNQIHAHLWVADIARGLLSGRVTFAVEKPTGFVQSLSDRSFSARSQRYLAAGETSGLPESSRRPCLRLAQACLRLLSSGTGNLPAANAMELSDALGLRREPKIRVFGTVKIWLL